MDWLRFYVSALDSAKVQALPGALFKAWVNCLCLARINDGCLPTTDVIAFRLRCSERQAEQWRDELTARKLIDITPDGAHRPHNWDVHQYVSDGSTQRVRKHREKRRNAVSETFLETKTEQPETVSVTPPDTDTEQIQIQSRTDTDSEAPRTVVQPIRRQEQNTATAEISTATWDSFRGRYQDSGKPLNESDWAKATMEAITQNLGEADLIERVMPALEAELPGWADRELAMIPYPSNWLKSQPWTRKAKPRDPPLTREQRKQREIDDQWGGARATL
jgi:hypothetical protein